MNSDELLPALTDSSRQFAGIAALLPEILPGEWAVHEPDAIAVWLTREEAGAGIPAESWVTRPLPGSRNAYHCVSP